MVTKIKFIPLTVLVIILLGFSCNKQPLTCPKMGYEYTYIKPGVVFSPSTDSIALGDSIILEACAPRTFFDEEKLYNVTLDQNNILGPLGINKSTNDPLMPRTGAVKDVIITPLIGSIIKDSIHFSAGQLEGFRTAYCTLISDSFRLKLSIKPTIRGIFFILLGQQGNRDNDCALFRYFLKIKDTDQHLHYLAQYNNGIIDESARNYLYCFKVY